MSEEVAPAEQLDLIPEGWDGLYEPGQPGVSTGARVQAQRPKVYEWVLRALAEGMSMRSIRRLTGLHYCTIAAIREHAGQSIESQKKSIANDLRMFAKLGAERLIEDIDAIPLQTLPIAMGIAVQRGMELEGAPTVIHEHRLKRISDFRPLLDALPVDAVEIDLAGGEREQKGAAPAGPAADLAGGQAVGPEEARA